MSKIFQTFSHPIIAVDDFPDAESIADRFYAKSMQLMQDYPDAGLISDAWHSGRRATRPEDIQQHGFTSYYSENLSRLAEFDFINKAALEVCEQYLHMVGKGGAPIRMGNAWSSVYGRGHYIPQHTHPLSHLSVVFYAAATEGTGQLVFENPAIANFQHFYPPEICWMRYHFSIQPQKGLFVVFPSYLVHNTEPHQSDALRVIYSANVQLEFAKLTDAERAQQAKSF